MNAGAPTAAGTTPSSANSYALQIDAVSKRFARGKATIAALDHVSLEVPYGRVAGVLGPDGAGKTTLLRIAAGLLRPAEGTVEVLGYSVPRNVLPVHERIGYMPQEFGLYEDLSVQENIDLYADLQGVPKPDRKPRYDELLDMTGLAPFISRLAGRLSGGMKQKLGLACTLLRSPDLLLLDEPTVGVDPVSRRELWKIVFGLVEREEMTVLLSTSYFDEAERCDQVAILRNGVMLGQGAPHEFRNMAEGRTYRSTRLTEKPRHIQAKLFAMPEVIDADIDAGTVRVLMDEPGDLTTAITDLAEFEPVPPQLEDGFMTLLYKQRRESPEKTSSEPSTSDWNPNSSDNGTVVQVENLKRRFGDFYAVKGITFNVAKGEIFGLLGPNGAGKSTTFRMLCGLLPVSEGRLKVAGYDLRRAPAVARGRVGYVAQKFSLYGPLSSHENLKFFSKAYGLRGKQRRQRIDWAIDEFALRPVLDVNTEQLPIGYQKRLAMAAALMHEPDILFLDEPTSGVDPVARREFWQRINALADAGVTIIVTTHFMEEAEYCDRLAIMVAGELLALGSPDEIREESKPPEDKPATIEDAFIALVEQYPADDKSGTQ